MFVIVFTFKNKYKSFKSRPMPNFKIVKHVIMYTLSALRRDNKERIEYESCFFLCRLLSPFYKMVKILL